MLRFNRHVRSTEGCKPYQSICGAHAAVEGSRRVPAALVPHAAAKQDPHTVPVAVKDASDTQQSPFGGSRRSVLLSQLGLVPLALLAEAAAQPGAAVAAALGWPFGGSKASNSSSGINAAEAAVSSSSTDQPQQQPEGSSSAELGDDEDSPDEDEDSSSTSDDDDAVDSMDDDDDDDDSSSSSSSSSDGEQDVSNAAPEQQQEPRSSSGPDSGVNNNNSGSSSASSSSSSSSSSNSDPASSGNSGSSNGSNTSSSNGSNTDPGSPTSNGSGNGSSSSSSGSSNSRTGKGNVSANLSVNSYLQILRDARKASWPLIAQKISAGDWIELSQVLVQPPFDDVRQACFYIPWALLQSDDFTAAVAARKEYVEFIDHVHALATIALKAADGEPGADMQVQQSFMLLNASVEAYLAAIPPKYNRVGA